jgi:hypothetical protein
MHSKTGCYPYAFAAAIAACAGGLTAANQPGKKVWCESISKNGSKYMQLPGRESSALMLAALFFWLEQET